MSCSDSLPTYNSRDSCVSTEKADRSAIQVTQDSTENTPILLEKEQVGDQDTTPLLTDKKLSLVIDIDQTILHATRDSNIYDWVEKQKATEENEQWKDIYTFTFGRDNQLKLTLKLRPGLDDFLKELSQYYTLHIYTMGSRLYADTITSLVDPDGNLFGDRVMSRTENKGSKKKSLERFAHLDSSKAVVLDDLAKVWDDSPALVEIKPYEFFCGIGDINTPTNSPAAEANNGNVECLQPESSKEAASSKPAYASDILNITESDDILAAIKQLLINVHAEYFRQCEQDKTASPKTADIIAELKSRILNDCQVSLSKQEDGLSRLTKSLGAECSEYVTTKTTHLITKFDKPDILDAAAIGYPDAKIVDESWILESNWYWRKQDESTFLIVSDKDGEEFFDSKEYQEEEEEFFDCENEDEAEQPGQPEQAEEKEDKKENKDQQEDQERKDGNATMHKQKRKLEECESISQVDRPIHPKKRKIRAEEDSDLSHHVEKLAECLRQKRKERDTSEDEDEEETASRSQKRRLLNDM
ncbi:HAD-like domain-containing protein [Choanephora cucurbitarum]|nr:HAD-like domain-containing protein [Choanephora cucurbitarum]